MYTSEHHTLDDDAIRALLAAPFAGDLVTTGPDGLAATRLPFAYDPDAGELGTLCTHVSLVNPQSQASGEALVILTGPQAYVCSQWQLPDPRSLAIPTWDYVTVHAWGELAVDPDPAAVKAGLDLMTDEFGRAYHDDFRADKMPRPALEKMMRAIADVRVRVTRWQGKAKMSQNRPPVVVERIADSLALRGEREAAQWYRERSLPRAQAKKESVDSIRADVILRTATKRGTGSVAESSPTLTGMDAATERSMTV